jgi:hypothetical protein
VRFLVDEVALGWVFHEYFGVTVSVSIHQPSMFTDSFIYDRSINYFKKFNYLGSMITNDARYTYKCEIKSRTTMEKQHSTRKRLISPSKWTEV